MERNNLQPMTDLELRILERLKERPAGMHAGELALWLRPIPPDAIKAALLRLLLRNAVREGPGGWLLQTQKAATSPQLPTLQAPSNIRPAEPASPPELPKPPSNPRLGSSNPAFPPTRPLQASKQRWLHASFNRHPFETYRGVQDLVRNYIKSPTSWSIDGKKPFDYLLRHLNAPETDKPSSRAVSSDGLLEERPADQPILSAFVHQAKQLLTHTAPEGLQIGLHLLAGVSADDRDVIATVRQILGSPARHAPATLHAALDACASCFRRLDDLEALYGFFDSTAPAWRSVEALARVAMYRKDALRETDSARVMRWMIKTLAVLEADALGIAGPSAKDRAVDALYFLLRRRCYDAAFLSPGTAPQREFRQRLEVARRFHTTIDSPRSSRLLQSIDTLLFALEEGPECRNPARLSEPVSDAPPAPATFTTEEARRLSPQQANTVQSLDPDSDQAEVIKSPSDSFQMVTAPPGAGKTAVACARIAWLAKQGVPPARILMISFTRVAVAEFRDRIERMATEVPDIRGVEITTLDSYVWHLLKGFAEDQAPTDLLGGYDKNIATTAQKLAAGDPALTHWLEQFQHIVIDEAQDLVGPRAALVAQILKHRGPGAGATVFADEAQAIYGFTSDEDSGQPQDTFFEVLDKIGLKPERRELRTIHRTNNARLKDLFLQSRKPLTERVSEPKAAYSGARTSIKEHADKDAGGFDDVAGTLKDSHALVLFRTRAQVLLASSLLHHNHKIPHRLRMSGLPLVIEPWIGMLLSDYVEADLPEATFRERWAAEANHPCLKLHGRNVDSAWRALHELAPGRRHSIDLRRLRTVLARTKAPVGITVPEVGNTGPILGTIHASKGREAKHVLLMLPRDSSELDDADDSGLLEEGRVLYVGATRAISELTIGDSFQCRSSSLDGGRVYRLVKHNAQVEIGRDADVLPNSPVSRVIQRDEAECRASQAWLAQHVAEPFDLDAACVGGGDWSYRITVNEALRIGCLAPCVNTDLFEVARRLNLGRVRPPMRLNGLWLAGVRTTCLAAEDPLLDQIHEPYSKSGLFLSPIVRGFPIVFFSSALQSRDDW